MYLGFVLIIVWDRNLNLWFYKTNLLCNLTQWRVVHPLPTNLEWWGPAPCHLGQGPGGGWTMGWRFACISVWGKWPWATHPREVEGTRTSRRLKSQQRTPHPTLPLWLGATVELSCLLVMCWMQPTLGRGCGLEWFAVPSLERLVTQGPVGP